MMADVLTSGRGETVELHAFGTAGACVAGRGQAALAVWVADWLAVGDIGGWKVLVIAITDSVVGLYDVDRGTMPAFRAGCGVVSDGTLLTLRVAYND